MKHVEPRPWLSVNFPSLCKAWNVEYHVYRGWYGEKTEKDLFYEIRNDAYFGEFSFVDAVKCSKEEVLLKVSSRPVGQYDSESYIQCEVMADWREDESLNEAGKKGGATTS